MTSRIGWWASVCLVLAVAAPVSAKTPKKDKKDEAAAPSGGLMEDGEKDPAETESGDDSGQFVPGRKSHAGEESDEVDEGKTPEQREKEKEAAKKAEPPKKKHYGNRKTIGVFAEALIGFGKAPVPGAGNPAGGSTTGDATSYAFLVGGHFDLTPEFRLMLRVPFTVGTVGTVTGDASTNALGNPEILARYRLTDPGDIEWAVRLGIGIPVAQGNPDFTNVGDASGFAAGRLQTVADGANGWHDPELYAVKRLPISPALQFTDRADKLRLNAELKAVVMPKVGGTFSNPGASGPNTNYSLNSIAFTAILGGSASYELFDHFYGALAAWLTYVPAAQIDYTSQATAPSPFQFVIEPRLLAQFGKIVPSVGFVLPVAGQLGGNIYGVRIHIDAVF
jgi:hypothetical protein